ncbi:hypothetical protein FTV88_1595 [Heliorestis convoluta]|uniref:Uncharacterized protein YyaB-like PH domain-containing protein n=1 Tax=Heliorestis convoluta TaxID=356322 RepID=A0A5Q2N532_9FIRM|nr:hypothetical protein FTV88_1595 [Heliorestis convoluta]
MSIQCGPLNKTISYHEIQRVRKIRTFQSGPALSIERLEIIHGEPANSIFISPEYREDFVSKLKQRCPQMKIEGSIRS